MTAPVVMSLAVSVAFTGLLGCGQRGPLTLPKPLPSAPASAPTS